MNNNLVDLGGFEDSAWGFHRKFLEHAVLFDGWWFADDKKKVRDAGAALHHGGKKYIKNVFCHNY